MINQTTPLRSGFLIPDIFMSRIVVFANGEFSQPDMLRRWLRPTDRIYCADGGTVHALYLGITPDVIVGDLDSVPAHIIPQLEGNGVIVHRYPQAKDQTDLELTLEYALAENPDEIMLVSAMGGRIDQMLANVFLLSREAYRHTRMTLVHENQLAVLVRGGQTETITGQAGDTVSLVPLSPEVDGVTFTGVAWPLHQATLTFGSSWSISNQMTGNEATVTIAAGMALFIHLHQI
jgi:thiamine pyrophosphokinase